jgi:DNA-binding NarL/FixJ family response regulator
VNNVSVYICDNYGALRDLMRFSLEDDPRIGVVGEAEDAITCVRELPEKRPDVLVLDLRMPGVTGLEAVPQIRAASPDTRIVVYSQYIDERTEAELAEAGVEAWLRKDEDLSELRATVVRVGGL